MCIFWYLLIAFEEKNVMNPIHTGKCLNTGCYFNEQMHAKFHTRVDVKWQKSEQNLCAELVTQLNSSRSWD